MRFGFGVLGLEFVDLGLGRVLGANCQLFLICVQKINNRAGCRMYLYM